MSKTTQPIRGLTIMAPTIGLTLLAAGVRSSESRGWQGFLTIGRDTTSTDLRWGTSVAELGKLYPEFKPATAAAVALHKPSGAFS